MTTVFLFFLFFFTFTLEKVILGAAFSQRACCRSAQGGDTRSVTSTVHKTVGWLTEGTGESEETSAIIVLNYILRYARISDANSKCSISQLGLAEEYE